MLPKALSNLAICSGWGLKAQALDLVMAAAKVPECNAGVGSLCENDRARVKKGYIYCDFSTCLPSN